LTQSESSQLNSLLGHWFSDLTDQEQGRFGSIVADRGFLKKNLSDQKAALRQLNALRTDSDGQLEMWLLAIRRALLPGFEKGVSSSEKWNGKAYALNQLRPFADSGDPIAQCKVGDIYEFGSGGSFLFEGILQTPIPENYAEALSWYRKAADQGYTEAQVHLGVMYGLGWGVPRDDTEATRWYRKAADQGNATAQFEIGDEYWEGKAVPQNFAEAVLWFKQFVDPNNFIIKHQLNDLNRGTILRFLGDIYHNGQGVPQDYPEAARWYRKAADQGDTGAQLSLGEMYYNGQGMPQDYVQAYMWFNLAAANGDKSAQNKRERAAQRMSREQIAQGQDMTRNRKAPQSGPEATGTGFFVASQGEIVTNFHVIEGCSALKLPSGSSLHVIAHDEGNDLALLISDRSAPQFANFNAGPVRVGQSVMAVGYPLRGLLSSGANVTTGNVSALAGPNDDTGLLQITAPVQPGNSGGPLLDQSGNVIGVVVAKLDAVKIARATGDIPQNVNFAIKGAVVRSFLEANGVEFSTAASTARLDPIVIAERATKATVVVECWK